MGGGMRQAGFLAAAGIFALDNNVERLKEDHENAKQLGEALAKCDYVENIRPIKTNIVIFDVKAPCNASILLDYLKENGLRASAFGPQTVRFVTHLEITTEMITTTATVLRNFSI
jgi:threonine aldolase